MVCCQAISVDTTVTRSGAIPVAIHLAVTIARWKHCLRKLNWTKLHCVVICLSYYAQDCVLGASFKSAFSIAFLSFSHFVLMLDAFILISARTTGLVNIEKVVTCHNIWLKKPSNMFLTSFLYHDNNSYMYILLFNLI